MRSLNPSVKCFIAVLTLALIPAADAGIIDLLRSGPKKSTTPPLRMAVVGAAEVKEVEGKVEYLVGIDEWKTLPQGMRLKPGEIVRTGEGNAILKMEESGSLVKVNRGTVLRLEPLNKEWGESVITGSRKQEGYVVRSVKGEAFIRSDEGEWRSLEVDTILEEGTLLKASQKSVIDLYSTKKHRSIRLTGISQVRLSAELTNGQVNQAPVLASAVR